ncbi:hypothetical protein V8Z74_14680 [Comamonas sp. w2-DMI]|uniref:hypothetical protein n=1 Tax=Comamonas sp. w2-DMI TaxID=3126391 RepID=UPI0032E4CBEC
MDISPDIAHFLIQPSFEHCLSEKSLEIVRTEQVERGVPVVFLAGEQAVDIVTGQLQPKETSSAARICYFHFTRETSLLIAKETRTQPEFLPPCD